MHIGRHAHSRIRSWSPQNTSLIYFANALMVTHVLHCALQWQCFLPTSKTQAYKCNNPSRKPPPYKEPKSRRQLRDVNPRARRPPSQSSDRCASAAQPAARPRWNLCQTTLAERARPPWIAPGQAARPRCTAPDRPGQASDASQNPQIPTPRLQILTPRPEIPTPRLQQGGAAFPHSAS